MTQRRAVALVVGLVVIFAVALVAGVGGEGGGASEAGDGASTGSSDLRTAAFTVALGFVVFVLGQIAQRFFLEPMQEQKRIIGEIAFAVLYYGNVSIIAVPERQQEAITHLRKLAGQLRATLWTVPWYRLFESLRMVEKRENVLTASEQLVGWSNSVYTKDGGAPLRSSAIVKALRLPWP